MLVVIELSGKGPGFDKRLRLPEASACLKAMTARIQLNDLRIYFGRIERNPVPSFVEVVIETEKPFRRIIAEASCYVTRPRKGILDLADRCFIV